MEKVFKETSLGVKNTTEQKVNPHSYSCKVINIMNMYYFFHAKKNQTHFFKFQLRGAQILDAVRLHKNGFPENLNYGEFWRRYRILSDELQKRQPTLTEMKASVEDLLADMDLDKSAFRLGNTQVSFFLIIIAY